MDAMPNIASNPLLAFSIYVQPPNAATVPQRQAGLARLGLAERQDARGRRRVFRFAEPGDTRPARLADNLRNVGTVWTEWEYGVAGNLPAKLWKEEHTAKSPHASRYSRRKPIYLLLDRLINIKKKLPAEAFRLVEKHFSGISMTKLADEIRRRERNGTMHPDLADRRHPLQLKQPRKRTWRMVFDRDGI